MSLARQDEQQEQWVEVPITSRVLMHVAALTVPDDRYFEETGQTVIKSELDDMLFNNLPQHETQFKRDLLGTHWLVPVQHGEETRYETTQFTGDETDRPAAETVKERANYFFDRLRQNVALSFSKENDDEIKALYVFRCFLEDEATQGGYIGGIEHALPLVGMFFEKRFSFTPTIKRDTKEDGGGLSISLEYADGDLRASYTFKMQYDERYQKFTIRYDDHLDKFTVNRQLLEATLARIQARIQDALGSQNHVFADSTGDIQSKIMQISGYIPFLFDEKTRNAFLEALRDVEDDQLITHICYLIIDCYVDRPNDLKAIVSHPVWGHLEKRAVGSLPRLLNDLLNQTEEGAASSVFDKLIDMSSACYALSKLNMWGQVDETQPSLTKQAITFREGNSEYFIALLTNKFSELRFKTEEWLKLYQIIDGFSGNVERGLRADTHRFNPVNLVQGFLLREIGSIPLDASQQESLDGLSRCLFEGRHMLLARMEKLNRYPNNKKFQHEAHLLRAAIGLENAADKNTFHGLINHIEQLKQKAPITITHLMNVYASFEKLVGKGVIEPLAKYNADRPFLKKFGEWVLDTVKHVLGLRAYLSTTGTLKKVIALQQDSTKKHLPHEMHHRLFHKHTKRHALRKTALSRQPRLR